MINDGFQDTELPPNYVAGRVTLTRGIL